jgi:hypothetical protein
MPQRNRVDAWGGLHAVPSRGTLVCDDYSGYKALFASGVTEAGCLAHARRKFHELYANHQSTVGEQALALFGRLYGVEREAADLNCDERRRIRQEKSKPVADALHSWLTAQRQKVPPGSATAKAIDYSLGRWKALTRYMDSGDLPADNNWVENQIRPIAIGRSNWLFAGSLRAGKRAAAVMSLIHSARVNGHDPLRVLARRPRAAAHAARQPRRRVAAALLEGGDTDRAKLRLSAPSGASMTHWIALGRESLPVLETHTEPCISGSQGRATTQALRDCRHDREAETATRFARSGNTVERLEHVLGV